MLHRALPARAPRFCATVWLDAEPGRVNAPAETQLRAKHLDPSPAGVARIAGTPLQRVLSRAVMAEEYEASIQECMQGGRGAKCMLLIHRKHVAALAKNPALASFVAALRARKATAAPPRWYAEAAEGGPPGRKLPG